MRHLSYKQLKKIIIKSNKQTLCVGEVFTAALLTTPQDKWPNQ